MNKWKIWKTYLQYINGSYLQFFIIKWRKILMLPFRYPFRPHLWDQFIYNMTEELNDSDSEERFSNTSIVPFLKSKNIPWFYVKITICAFLSLG